MRLMDKKKRVIDTRRPNYAVFRKRRRNTFLIIALTMLVLLGLGLYLLSGTSVQETSEAPTEEQADTPAVEETPQETEEDLAQPQETEEDLAQKKAAEEKAAKEAEEDSIAAAAPEDPTLYLTVPRLGIYNHTVRNDDSEAALDLGAIKLPSTDFPWEKGDTNTYIACHRLGWPSNESYHQCLNLPVMQQGDEMFLKDANGRVYTYRVTEALQVTPWDYWVKAPIEGKHTLSLQTCIENLGNVWTLGPNWSDRYIVRAERVGVS
ncbi:MAG: class E sortase [Actinomycetota bacterium]|nr:class E sortase [Actinomycetota bacterium]